MSSWHHGPSLSDQGFGPEDAHVGNCANCTTPLDVAAMEMGGGVYDRDGRLLCADCASGNYRCAAGCGYPVAHPNQLCGECACEDDCDIW